MSTSFVITKYHKTYYRDALIFGLIGFIAAFVYFILRAFTEIAIGGIGLIIFVFFFIYRLKTKFKPESFEFKPLNDKISVWRRNEFKNDEPYQRQLLSYERTAEGLKINVKELGTSTIKTQFMLSSKDYGEENLGLLSNFLISLQKADSHLPDKNINVAYRPRLVPAELVGYFVTIGIFFFYRCLYE